jgi:hypothetical protein
MVLSVRTNVVALGFAVAVFACSSTTNTTTNNFGSQPVATPDCKSRCQTKATGCGAPAADATQACDGVCDGTYTNDQLACLEGKSCQELQSASSSLASLCPKGSSSSSGGSSGGSSSGSTGTFKCSLNGICYKCNDSEGVSKCSLTNGPGPGCTRTDASFCN